MAKDAFDYRELFGALSSCSCGEYRSIGSPAAYLVDLLSFLVDVVDKQNNVVNPQRRNLLYAIQPALQGLSDTTVRRPDLAEIKLSRVNTGTALPCIDLVNEILEYAVASPSPRDPTKPPAPKPDGWPQTTAAPEDLLIHPEHRIQAAYDTLLQPTFPWQLPFFSDWEEARAWLGALSVKRDELMYAFRVDPLTTDAETAIGLEYLGISPKEADKIALTPKDRWIPWFPADPAKSWSDLLHWVSNSPLRPANTSLLGQSGLSYPELLDLLNSRFINGDSTHRITIEFAGADGDISQATFVIKDDHLNPTTLQDSDRDKALDRIHRYTRLRRRLGWPTRDLDKAILALSATDIDKPFLLQLSYVEKLVADLKLPLTAVLSFFASIDTNPGDGGSPSFYDQFFQNAAVVGVAAVREFKLQDFKLNQKRDLVQAKDTISQHLPGVLAGLGIISGDLSLLLADLTADKKLNPQGTDPSFTLTNLSYLYRHVALAHGLGLDVSGLRSLKALSGSTLFDGGDVSGPAGAWQFVQTARRVAATRFSIAELDYLLRDVISDRPGIAPSDTQLAVILSEIQAGLLKINADAAAAVDPDGGRVQAIFAQLVTAGSLTSQDVRDAMAFIASGTKSDGTAATLNDQQTYFGRFGVKVTDVVAQLTLGLPLADRYTYLLRAWLLTDPTLRQKFIQQKLAAALKLDPSLAASLFAQLTAVNPNNLNEAALGAFMTKDFIAAQPPLDVSNANNNPAWIPAQTLRKLWKVSLVIHKLRIDKRRLGTDSDPAWLIKNAGATGWLNLDKLPVDGNPKDATLFAGLLRLCDFFSLWNAVGPGNPSFYELFDEAIAAQQSNSKDDKQFLADLASRTGWNSDDLTTLIGTSKTAGTLGLSFPKDFANERPLVRLHACFDLLARLGVSAAQVKSQAGTWLDPSDASNAPSVTNAIRQAAKGRYDENAWRTAAQPIEDGLRRKRRDALVAYLIGWRGFEDEIDLFDWFLIDTQVAPCLITSRLVQAIASVQLYIERVLMSLESGVALDLEQAKQYSTWMKRYRIWQANRLVLAYPENYLHSALRDNKTPFFKELETELLQREVTLDSAEDAFRRYLERLDEVALLEAAAMCHELDDDGTDVLHVMARTRSTPHRYFYRTLTTTADGSTWSAWEKMDVDIQGDHLIAAMWNRRLHIFWPIFTEKPDDPKNQKGRTHLEIQLAWSEYKGGKWATKKLSSSASDHVLMIHTSALVQDATHRSVMFGVDHPTDGGLAIWMAANAVESSAKTNKVVIDSGSFVFEGCGSDPTSGDGSLSPVTPVHSKTADMAFAATGKLTLPWSDGGQIQILTKSPSAYDVLYEHQKTLRFQLNDSFFYQDGKRVFFARQADITPPLAFAAEAPVSLGILEAVRQAIRYVGTPPEAPPPRPRPGDVMAMSDLKSANHLGIVGPVDGGGL